MKLTPREVEVLRALARGFRYADIAFELGISPQTAASHIKNLYRKLGVHSAAAAVMRGVQLRFIAVEP